MTTLLQLFEQLATDPATKARFALGPERYLQENGFGNIAPDDLAEALTHAADSFPPALADAVDLDDGLDSLAAVDLGLLGLAGIDDFDSEWDPRPEPPAQDALDQPSPVPPEDDPFLEDDGPGDVPQEEGPQDDGSHDHGSRDDMARLGRESDDPFFEPDELDLTAHRPAAGRADATPDSTEPTELEDADLTAAPDVDGLGLDDPFANLDLVTDSDSSDLDSLDEFEDELGDDLGDGLL